MTTLPELIRVHGYFKPTGILHVGAAMLEEAEVYHQLVGEKVMWVEAQPHSPLRKERADKFGQILFENVPFSDKTEPVILSITNNEVSSSILPLKRHSEIYPDIVVTQALRAYAARADDFFEAGLPSDINTLVLDVQGAELKVLKGMGKLLDQIEWIWAEVNLKELYEGCVLKPELDHWLAQHGFPLQEFFPVHHGEWGESLYRRDPRKQ